MAHYKAQTGAVIASPNVIPMADIMLVLLIIFMVVMPMVNRDARVNLAEVANPVDMPNADKDDAVVVAISSDGTVFLGNNVTPMEEISSRVRDRISSRLDKTVYIKSDARTKYGDVVRLVDQVRNSGVDSVGLLTDKIQRRIPPPSI
jgi:biopolymer transport protein ExbD/biopolymer transport protein TolR